MRAAIDGHLAQAFGTLERASRPKEQGPRSPRLRGVVAGEALGLPSSHPEAPSPSAAAGSKQDESALIVAPERTPSERGLAHVRRREPHACGAGALRQPVQVRSGRSRTLWMLLASALALASAPGACPLSSEVRPSRPTSTGSTSEPSSDASPPATDGRSGSRRRTRSRSGSKSRPRSRSPPSMECASRRRSRQGFRVIVRRAP
jgi:hypothetical protein